MIHVFNRIMTRQRKKRTEHNPYVHWVFQWHALFFNELMIFNKGQDWREIVQNIGDYFQIMLKRQVRQQQQKQMLK